MTSSDPNYRQSASHVGPSLVCFDLWNTLIFESEPGELVRAREVGVVDALRRRGSQLERGAFSWAHAIAQQSFETAWEQGRQFRAEDACRIIAAELELTDDLAGPVHEGYIEGVRQADIRLVPGAQQAVAAARSLGARTAIVCDVGLTPSEVLIDWLDEFGFDDAFDCLAFSDRVGAYKPAPDMFEWVCNATGGDRRTALHIGDRRRTDVCGAFNFGMRTVRFRGVYDDQSAEREADHVVDDMEEFVALLRGD